jgi:hypothetical protein
LEQAQSSLKAAQRRWAETDPEAAELRALRATQRQVQAAMLAGPPRPRHIL